ncbi:MAG: hypothetical protein LBQ06_01915 [Frankiaceae bacterium]|nr:hypothetical protein [Frankiaceae bacterium]
MIVAAAFCPHPPLLVPMLARGAAGDLAGVRAASIEAIQRAARASGGSARLLVLGSAPASMIHSPLARGTFAPLGADVEVGLGSPSRGGALELSLSLSVGAWLVGAALGPRSGAMGLSVGPGFAASQAAADLPGLLDAGDWALVVMGDGSARPRGRSPGAPDAPAPAPLDDTVARALSDGDCGALAALDSSAAARLLCAGAPAWIAAGGLLAGACWEATLGYAGAPYGVAYFVASWRRAG